MLGGTAGQIVVGRWIGGGLAVSQFWGRMGIVIYARGPWRGLEPVEYSTLEWVDWFNHRRLLEPIGHVPPREFEEMYYRQLSSQAMAA